MARPHLSKRLHPSFLLLFAALGLASMIQSAQAQYTPTQLYTFSGGGDGADPTSVLIFDSNGNLYGTAQNGGNTSLTSCPGQDPPTGCGVVLELTPPAGGGSPWNENVLYTFSGGSDGAYPYAAVVFYQGNLYGTTTHGGNTSGSNCSAIGGCGVVFELSPPSGGSGPWTENVLYTFDGGADGSVPYGGLIFDSSGNLYGTASGGGQLSGGIQGFGVVFELSPPSGGGFPWTETVLYTFTGANDGDTPLGGVIFDSKGNLYGTTAFGGYYANGVVFQLTPNGGSFPWNQTVIYPFTGKGDGGFPYAGVTFDSMLTNLYGTTSIGGDISGANCKSTRGCGVVFELSPPVSGTEWTENLPYVFTGGSDGGYPEASVVFDTKGNLYSTTVQGGDLSGSNCSATSGCGVVFELTPSGSYPWNETEPYTFQGGSDGGFPYAGVLLDSLGDIFGTASAGGQLTGSNCSGAFGCGVVYELMAQPATGVTITPSSLKFGNQIVDTTSPAKSVTLTNNGPGKLNITSITPSGDFQISANSCGAQLGAGKSCKVSVTFTPLQLGPLTGTLTFTDSAPNSPQTVPLSGTGIAAVTLTPSSANYGKEKVGTTSKPKKFTLSNSQTTTLTNIVISTTGDFAELISGTTCGSTLAGKQHCTISVTFTPTQTGTRTGELQVSDSAGNSPQTASLSGTGD